MSMHVDGQWRAGRSSRSGKPSRQLRDDVPWLQEYSYGIVRYTLEYQADAWQQFFAGKRGYPKWKNRYQTPSFTIPDNIRISDGQLAIPKLGWFDLHRRGGNPYPEGKPLQVTVKHMGKRWYATICYEVHPEHPVHNGHAIGVDRNVGQIADSDGEIHRMPELQRLNTRLRRHQRALARKRKDSNRRKAARRKVTRAARRLANARKAWQHRVTRKLSDKAGTVVIEKLNTRGMTRSAQGTAEAPGHECQSQGWPQPGDSQHRLGGDGANAVLQGGGAGAGSGGLHLTDLQCMRCGRRRLPTHPGEFQVRGLRPCAECGPECGPQHSGVGDWRIWTARGVWIANPYDPSNGYGNYPWVITCISPNS